MEVTDDEFPDGVDKPENQEVPELELSEEHNLDNLGFGLSDGLSSPQQRAHVFSETDSAIEQSIYDRALWDAKQSLQQNADLKFPWESGIFSEIFGNGSISILGPTDSAPSCFIPNNAAELVSMVEPVAQRADKRHRDVPLHTLVSASRRDADAVQLEDEAWETAISK